MSGDGGHVGRRTRHDATNVHLDAVDAGAAGDVEGLAVLLTPGHVADHLRDFDGPEMLALRRNDPDPTRAGTEDVSFLVHP